MEQTWFLVSCFFLFFFQAPRMEQTKNDTGEIVDEIFQAPRMEQTDKFEKSVLFILFQAPRMEQTNIF